MNKKRSGINILLLVAALILVLVFLYSGLQILESTVLYRGEEQESVGPSKTITRDGVDYFPRQDITVLMVLGIDQYGPVVDSGSYNNSGNVDMIFLMVFDETREEVSVLSINRDTMAEIPVLGIGGKPAGSIYAQLALSHSYGSGLEDSCENTKKAVSDFLGKIQIDSYVSMNMDAVSILNDAVGGVQVEVVDDFSKVDSTIPMGTVTLNGEQAIHYVRIRKDVGDQMNLSRMERQKGYMQGFMEALRTKVTESSYFVTKTYEQVSPYIVTDCSVNTLSSMLNRYADYQLTEIVTPEGDNVEGEAYMEFHVDEEALDELILRLFYAPKK